MYLDIDQNLEYIKVFFFFFSTLGSIVYAANIPVLYSLYCANCYSLYCAHC